MELKFSGFGSSQYAMFTLNSPVDEFVSEGLSVGMAQHRVSGTLVWVNMMYDDEASHSCTASTR